MSSARTRTAHPSSARSAASRRSIKAVDLAVRPIHHWAEPRVRAHVFLCPLAYYVQWHPERAWAPLLLRDEVRSELVDPIAPAQRSAAALHGGFVAITQLVAVQLARLTRFASRLTLVAALILLAVALAACGSGSGVPGTSAAASADTDAPTIVARGTAFTTKELTVPAGKAFSLVFENQDGEPHNVTIFAEGADPVFVGDTFAGPATKSYAAPALATGRYRFRCDVHPEMTGTLVVE